MAFPGQTGLSQFASDKFGGAGGLPVAVDLTAVIDGAKHNMIVLPVLIYTLVLKHWTEIHRTGNVKLQYGAHLSKIKNPDSAKYRAAENGVMYQWKVSHIPGAQFQAGAGLGAGLKPAFALELVKNPESSTPTRIRRWVIPYEGVTPLFDPRAVPAVDTN